MWTQDSEKGLKCGFLVLQRPCMDLCLSSMVPCLTKRPHMSIYDSPNPEFLADLRVTESYRHLKGNTQLLIISTELDVI